MNNKDAVQTYRLKMQKWEGQGLLFCHGLSITRIPHLITTFKHEDDFNFYFTTNVECFIKDVKSDILIDRYFFSSNYILEKNKQTENFKLTEGLLYKITYNKIDLHD